MSAMSKLGKGPGYEREELSKDLETRFQMFNQDALESPGLVLWPCTARDPAGAG